MRKGKVEDSADVSFCNSWGEPSEGLASDINSSVEIIEPPQIENHSETLYKNPHPKQELPSDGLTVLPPSVFPIPARLP